MTTMVDKVSAAIRINLMAIDCGFEMTDDESRDMALAAIEAMMEPTDEVLRAADTSVWFNQDENDLKTIAVMYRAMIQAALKEEGQ